MSATSSVLERVTSAVAELAEVDPALLADGEAIVDLHRQLERLAAVTTRATAAFDASGAWQHDGARSAAAWLSTRCRMPATTARRRVRLGRALRHLPAVEAAWLAGDIGEAQVSVVERARTPGSAEAMGRDEAMLVGEATRLRFAIFAQVLAYWGMRADPDGAEDRSKAQADTRRFDLSQSFADMWFADGRFDPIRGTILADELQRIGTELFDADWAEATARVGEGVCLGDLGRTPAQRRADALVEMATRSAAAAPGSRRPEPLFSVVIGLDTFSKMLCELADGTVVSPGSLKPWIDDAWVERVVFDGPSRVLDVGVQRRLFDGATRRAVELRDRECFHRLCYTPAANCEVDHIQPWSAGGPTTQANGRLACGFHCDDVSVMAAAQV